jgi:hypothetical protein
MKRLPALARHRAKAIRPVPDLYLYLAIKCALRKRRVTFRPS